VGGVLKDGHSSRGWGRRGTSLLPLANHCHSVANLNPNSSFLSWLLYTPRILVHSWLLHFSSCCCLSCLSPDLPLSCLAPHLSCLAPTLSHSYPVSILSCLTPFMSNSYPVSLLFCFTPAMSHTCPVSLLSCLTPSLSHS
jgi:hypothetical protein